VRVISGKARGRRLKAPKEARPLTDQAKEALFNILRNDIDGRSFLDVFAGSGAVGIEALSRGARRAVFIEQNRQAVAIIRGNLELTGLAEQAEVFQVEATRGLKLLARKGERFEVVFLGAPYDSPALAKCLEILGSEELLATGAIVIAEHRRQHGIEAGYGALKAGREARYGETVLTFYENSDLSR
jgi:16S rRNA (guanine966-N2)-methyltransferase